MDPDQIKAKVTRLIELDAQKKELSREMKVLEDEFRADAGDADWEYGDTEDYGAVKVSTESKSTLCKKLLIAKNGPDILIGCYKNSTSRTVRKIPPTKKAG